MKKKHVAALGLIFVVLCFGGYGIARYWVTQTETPVLGEQLNDVVQIKPTFRFDNAYKEIKWDALIPEDWDPKQGPVEQSLDGKRIRLAGCAIPLQDSNLEGGVGEFLLVPYLDACTHSPQPNSNQVVHVQLSEPTPVLGAMQAYWVWGELKVSRFSSALGDAAYELKGASIQPHVQ